MTYLDFRENSFVCLCALVANIEAVFTHVRWPPSVNWICFHLSLRWPPFKLDILDIRVYRLYSTRNSVVAPRTYSAVCSRLLELYASLVTPRTHPRGKMLYAFTFLHAVCVCVCNPIRLAAIIALCLLKLPKRAIVLARCSLQKADELHEYRDVEWFHI